MGAGTFLVSVTRVIYCEWEVPLCLLAPDLGSFFPPFFADSLVFDQSQMCKSSITQRGSWLVKKGKYNTGVISFHLQSIELNSFSDLHGIGHLEPLIKSQREHTLFWNREGQAHLGRGW